LRLPLTRLEFDLLDLLVQSAGRVVPYRELVERVLGCVFVPESTALRVHVAHLRRKLGGAAGAIVTVRGRGLCFDAEALWPG
jgi:two-component system response regulator CpxR